MPWLDQFKLGRPGFELDFEINPGRMSIDEGPVDVHQRNVAGDLLRSILKVSAPIMRLNSNFLLKAQRDDFAALVGIDDTFLSFQTRDDWVKKLERNFPLTTTTVIIKNTSATKLDVALDAVPVAGHITITGVFDNPAGTGTNFFTGGGGGSYARATRTITLGTPLAGVTDPVFVSYTYKGWLVSMKRLNHVAQGGWVDRFTYDFELTGV